MSERTDKTTASAAAAAAAQPAAARPDQGVPAGPAAPAVPAGPLAPAVPTGPLAPVAPAGPAGAGSWGWARWFFGVIAQRQTWLNVAYLLLAFPLGLLYFIFVVTGTAIGLGLAILWVGIPILLIVMGAWWSFAALERQLARLLLGVDCGPNPRPWEYETGALSRLRAHLTHPSTWRSLAFVLIKLPLGVASFALTVAVAAATQALLFAPLWALSARTEGSDRIVLWGIDTLWEALPLIPLGLLTLFVGLHLTNGMAALWRVLAEALLLEPAEAGAGARGDVGAAPYAAPYAPTPTAPTPTAPTSPPAVPTAQTSPPALTAAPADPIAAPADPIATHAGTPPGLPGAAATPTAPDAPGPTPATPAQEAPR